MGEIGHIEAQSQTGKTADPDSGREAWESLQELLGGQSTLVLATMGDAPGHASARASAPHFAARDLPRTYATPLFFASLPVASATTHIGQTGQPAPRLCFYSADSSVHGGHVGGATVEVAAAIHNQGQITSPSGPNFDVASIRGAQLLGTCQRLRDESGTRSDQELWATAKSAYLARFPFAARYLEKASHSLYLLTLRWAKITDNRRGLGQHLELYFAEDATSAKDSSQAPGSNPG